MPSSTWEDLACTSANRFAKRNDGDGVVAMELIA